MLEKLKILGLRGVGSVELTFSGARQVATLFGANGIGKTKCLEAIFQFLLYGNKTFQTEFGGHGVQAANALMRQAEDGAGHVLQIPNTNFIVNRVWAGGEQGFHDLPVVFLGAVNRSTLGADQARSALIGTYTQRRRSHLQELMNALETGDLRSLGMVGNIESWFVVRAQSVNPYQADSDKRGIEISTVLEVLNAIDQRVDSRFLQIDGSGRVSIKIADDVRLLSQLSSGFTSLLKLVQAIVAGYAAFTNEQNLRFVRGLVLIDEVESHLHAKWQSEIVLKLKSIFPNTYFYLATHSPLVLAQLDEGEGLLLARSETGVVKTEIIDSPSRKAFADVMESAFGVDLNAAKRSALARDDQALAKAKLLALLNKASE